MFEDLLHWLTDAGEKHRARFVAERRLKQKAAPDMVVGVVDNTGTYRVDLPGRPSRRVARWERLIDGLVHHFLGPRVIGAVAGPTPLGEKLLLGHEPELLGTALGTSLPFPDGVGSLAYLLLPRLVHDVGLLAHAFIASRRH
jgi:hypothetical protein